MENANVESDDLMTVPEAAAVAKVTQDAIRKAIYRSQLPSRQIYGRLLIKRADFESWCAKDRKKGPKGPRKQTEEESRS